MLGVHVQAIGLWVQVGWMGVDLFFVLSGFLISNLLFSEFRQTGSISLRSFYIRRALKLYPGFYLMLFSTFVFCIVYGWPVAPRAAIGELFFMQNYVGSLWGHTWSLAVEEHFYLILPVLLLFLARRSRGGQPFSQLPIVFVCVAVGCLAARIVTWKLVPFEYKVHFQLSHLRFDSLFFGVLLGYYLNFRPNVIAMVTGRYRMLLFYGSFVCLAPCIVLSNSLPYMYTAGFSLVYVGFGGLLLLAMFGRDGRLHTAQPAGWVERAMSKMGTFSYSIYLWHVPMAMVFMGLNSWLTAHHSNPGQYSLFVIYLAASVGFGVATAKLVEFPVLRLRDRYIPRRSVSTLEGSGEQEPAYSTWRGRRERWNSASIA